MQLQMLLLLALTPLISAILNSNLEHKHQKHDALPEPHQEQNLEYNELEERQVAAGGGVVATTLAASQYPISTTAGSLFTVNGVTSATWKLYVQTFATTALGTWELGPTPGVGSIGLGSIAGTVGKVKSKRALETPGPEVL